MTHSISEVLLVDPLDPGIRDGLSTPTPEAGEVVFLLADEGAHKEGWPGRAAIAIARDWSAAGRRVILADADVTGAGLHDQVGATNGEGVSDMVLYGASPSRVSRRPPGSGFLFMSAGTIVHEEGSVYTHPRWPGLLGAFRESGCVLVIYVPRTSETVRALATEGDRVYRLTANHAPPFVTDIAPDLNAALDAEDHSIDAEVASFDAEAEAVEMDDEPGVVDLAPGSMELVPGLLEDVDVPASADSWKEDPSEPPEELSIATSPPASASPSPAPFREEWSRAGDAGAGKPPLRPSAFAFSEEPPPARSLVNPLLLLGVFLLIVAAVLGAWLGYFAIPGIAE